MKLSKKKIILVGIAILVVMTLPFAAIYMLDSRQSPEQQLNELVIRSHREAAIIMKGHRYSTEVRQKECLNVGKSKFFSFGRDTVHCTYSINIHSLLSGKELRKLADAAGWRHLHVYEDGSGTDYRKNDAPICFLSDGKTYHSRKEFEANYIDGFLTLNCQNFTEHYDSPLPSPVDSLE